jgi:hypothetical protein
MAQFPSTWTPVVDLSADGEKFLEPIVTGAHGETEGVAGFANRLALIEHEAMKLRFLRLRWMVDAAAETPVDDKASLATRVHTTPSSRAGAIPSAALSSSFAENARRIGYRGSNAIPREEKIEQRVQQMFVALLGIACPDKQKYPGRPEPSQGIFGRPCIGGSGNGPAKWPSAN